MLGYIKASQLGNILYLDTKMLHTEGRHFDTYHRQIGYPVAVIGETMCLQSDH